MLFLSQDPRIWYIYVYTYIGMVPYPILVVCLLGTYTIQMNACAYMC